VIVKMIDERQKRFAAVTSEIVMLRIALRVFDAEVRRMEVEA